MSSQDPKDLQIDLSKTIPDFNQNHPTTKSKEKNRNFNCDICEKAFTTKFWMNSHVKNVHQDMKFNCDQCDKEFSSTAYLKRHIASEHDKIRLEL